MHHRPELPLRRQLFDWLSLRLADGRLPFRRAEEIPPVMIGPRVATPDLVLWINRDSLQAGAMIFTPEQTDPGMLEQAGVVAASLGLQQFVTWESRKVNLWSSAAPTLPLHSWQLPAGRSNRSGIDTATCEQLLLALKSMAVSALLPAAQLPAAYFANLCRQVLRDVASPLQETARLEARRGVPDSLSRAQARDKGWLTLWRILALLLHDHFPPGIKPELLDRAIGYALGELDQERYRLLAPAAGETPLPEAAAVRFHHLAGRLRQLDWQCDRERSQAAMTLLYSEAADDCGVDSTPLTPPPGHDDLLVNHLPLQPLTGAQVVAARPCLAALPLLGVAPPRQALAAVPALPAGSAPRRVVAALNQAEPPTVSERRRRLTALRQPWPWRRFQFAANTPGWAWDALHVAGMVDKNGLLQLTLPAAWTTTAGAELLWQSVTERLRLTKLVEHADGRQTLFWVGLPEAPRAVEVHCRDGTRRRFPALTQDTTLAKVAALTGNTPLAPPPLSQRPQCGRHPSSRITARQIAAQAFRDGLPKFPEHYLRRFDVPLLLSYDLPGPLHAEAPFFDRVQLCASDGSSMEASNPVEAEALLLASRGGRRRINLPSDPALTARLITTYRLDLQQLWQALLTECRRHRAGQRQALALARRIWKEKALPPAEGDDP